MDPARLIRSALSALAANDNGEARSNAAALHGWLDAFPDALPPYDWTRSEAYTFTETVLDNVDSREAAEDPSNIIDDIDEAGTDGCDLPEDHPSGLGYVGNYDEPADRAAPESLEAADRRAQDSQRLPGRPAD